MASSVTTSVTELPESRVRVDAEVPPEEIQSRVQQKARDLGRGLKVPGFRKGKVPPALVIQRIGRDAVLDEAIRDTLVDWYRDAIDVSGITPDTWPCDQKSSNTSSNFRARSPGEASGCSLACARR